MTMTRSQIERLGVRLVRFDPPADEDLGALHELLLAYRAALEAGVARVQRNLGISPSSRVKTTGTILEKLERYGGSWLKSIQDLAGMRIVGSFDRRGQDEVVAQLVELFSDGDRAPRVVDRRRAPSHGYRAVHVVVFVRSLPIEIQVRTELQHEWAELFEKLADEVGREIRYGEPPRSWLPTDQRGHLSEAELEQRDLRYGAHIAFVDFAQSVAAMIDAYELNERVDPTSPAVREFRTEVDAGLADLDDLLVQLSRIESSLD